MNLHISTLELSDSVACICCDDTNTNNHQESSEKCQLCQALGSFERSYGRRPKVDRALGRARIPRDIVSAIITVTVSLQGSQCTRRQSVTYSFLLAYISRQYMSQGPTRKVAGTILTTKPSSYILWQHHSRHQRGLSPLDSPLPMLWFSSLLGVSSFHESRCAGMDSGRRGYPMYHYRLKVEQIMASVQK